MPSLENADSLWSRAELIVVSKADATNDVESELGCPFLHVDEPLSAVFRQEQSFDGRDVLPEDHMSTGFNRYDDHNSRVRYCQQCLETYFECCQH